MASPLLLLIDDSTSDHKIYTNAGKGEKTFDIVGSVSSFYADAAGDSVSSFYTYVAGGYVG